MEEVLPPLKKKRHKPNRNQRKTKRGWKAILANANRIVHKWGFEVWEDVYVGTGVPSGV